MSTFTGLTTMVRGIFNNQNALNITGHNITNAATEGYSRQNINSVSTSAEFRSGIYGAYAVGTGVETQSITRSRDIFADKQYRQENATQQYYEKRARNYDSLEVIFNDSVDTGLAGTIGKFYSSLVNLSANASDSDQRVIVVNNAKVLCDLVSTDIKELQKEINSNYDDLSLHLEEVDELMEGIVNANKMIVAREAMGANANDLRDQRDLLVDELSNYMNINVTETSLGHYQINSGGVMLINGIDRLHLEMSRGISTASSDSGGLMVDYGISDYNIVIRESKQVYVPQNGMLKSEFDSVDECKAQMDVLINMSNFLLTTFNDMHHAGYDANGNVGGNFFGNENKTYEYGYDTQTSVTYVTVTNKDGTTEKITGVKIIDEFEVNSKLLGSGYDYIAAATRYKTKDEDGTFITYDSYSDLSNTELQLTWSTDTSGALDETVNVGDGTNAVYLSELFNMSFDTIMSEGRVNAAVIRKNADNNQSLIQQYGGEDDPRSYVFFNALSKGSVDDYYTTSMTDLAVAANTMDNKIDQQEALMVQIENWRDSAAGVDWNEELTNMIKYQKGFQSCARCLTAMDECLDRLVNNTGMVGR